MASGFTKRKLFPRGRIESDEGFSVAFGRDTVVYYESGRRMAITGDFSGSTGAIYADTIGRWDDDPLNAVNEKEKDRIANNIKRALEWDGIPVLLI